MVPAKSLPDVAFFRTLSTVQDAAGNPMMYILNPADAYATYALTLAMAAHEGPCYLRTMRLDVPFLYQDTMPFSLGGHHMLTAGPDLLIVAAGYMVHDVAVQQMYVRQIPKSGRTPAEVLHYLGLSADDIVQSAQALLQRSVRPMRA
jgi:transketolase C-terminal domain/subunit